MIKQLFFPFFNKQISEKDLQRFILANAGKYELKEWFYKFKKTFLEKYAEQDNYDLQTIEKECWTCEGSGIHWSGNHCYKCLNGIYETRKYFLKRYILNSSALFHIPQYPGAVEFKSVMSNTTPIIVNQISGIITHSSVDNKAAQRAFIYLLLKYDCQLSYALYCEYMREGKNKAIDFIKNNRLTMLLKRRRLVCDELPF